MKTTALIHDIEMKREDFLKLEKEGKKSKANFMSFDEFQNMEQVQKWTTSKVSQNIWREYRIHAGYKCRFVRIFAAFMRPTNIFDINIRRKESGN